jgi:phage terminase large subunit-like protein
MLPEAERLKILRQMRPEAVEALRYAWRFWGRPEQFAPGTPGAAPALPGHADLPEHLRSGPLPALVETADWTYWLLLAGRGFGKTRAGAEFAVEKARALPGSHGALVAATADDARKTMLSAGVEHVPEASGILAVSPPDFRPVYEPSKRIITWPNGTVATLYSAEEPNRLRGPQHHWAWVDEIAVWQKEQAAWDELLFGLRLGARPQACITTTPRPVKILRDLLRDPQTVVTRGNTYANRENLAPGFISKIIAKYEGTRLGRQELYAELLDDVPGALWTWERIEASRVQQVPVELRRIVVAIDPAVSSSETSDETGIVVAGVGPCRCRGTEELHGFVLGDLSGKYSPNGWAQRAVKVYHAYRADRIVAEVNNGGALVEMNLRTVDARVAYRAIHAAQGKRTRAEPIAALYEQGKVHHVGLHAVLEDQLTTWDPLSSARSPDRLDAMVWALSELMLHAGRHGVPRCGGQRRYAR